MKLGDSTLLKRIIICRFVSAFGAEALTRRALPKRRGWFILEAHIPQLKVTLQGIQQTETF
jgi:hypothetical protein